MLARLNLVQKYDKKEKISSTFFSLQGIHKITQNQMDKRKSSYLVKVEHQVQLAHIVKILIQDLSEHKGKIQS